MFKMRSEILVLKNTIFLYKIQIFGCQNTNFCFSKLAGLRSCQVPSKVLQLAVATSVIGLYGTKEAGQEEFKGANKKNRLTKL